MDRTVYVVLDIQHAVLMRLIATCGHSGSTTFFSHCLIKGSIFGGKKKLLNIQCVF
jgi:hypothetical protein